MDDLEKKLSERIETELQLLKLPEGSDIRQRIQSLIEGAKYFEEDGGKGDLIKIQKQFEDIKEDIKSENISKEKYISDFNGLFEDIKEYNNKHSLGMQMSFLFIAHLNANIGRSRNPIEDRINLEEILEKYGNTMDLIGMNTKGISAGGEMIGGGEESQPSKIDISLEDSEKFAAFLNSLKKEDIDKNMSLKGNLEYIYNAITSQFLSTYDYTAVEGDEKMLQVFSIIKNFIEVYKELSIDVSKLEKYYKYAQEGVLKENILIERKNLLAPIGEGFNMSTWHVDISTDRYKKDLEKMLEVLKYINENKNEKTIELHKDCKKHLIDAIDFAINQIGNYLDEDYSKIKKQDHYDAVYPELLDLAKEYKGKFENE